MASPRPVRAPHKPNPTVITVTGPTASGKTTLARGLAAILDLPFLDTSGSITSIALLMHERGGDPFDSRHAIDIAHSITPTDLRSSAPPLAEALFAAKNLRRDDEVREALLNMQRQYRSLPGVVAEERPAGPTFFPDASAKIRLTAPENVRALRLINRATARGDATGITAIYRNMVALDSAEAGSLADQTHDAVAIDTGQHDQLTTIALGLREIWPHLPEEAKAGRHTIGALALTVGTMACNTFDFMAKYSFSDAAKEARLALGLELAARRIVV